jgi:uncharacterized protein (DUF1778 family)
VVSLGEKKEEKMIEALKIILSKSSAYAGEAAQTIRAVSVRSTMAQRRYNLVAAAALGDPQADFTLEERAIIADSIRDETGESRVTQLQIRVSISEKLQIEDAAQAAGLSVSEFIRKKILFD